MKNKILEIMGWSGAVLILISFFLISFDFISPHTLMYQTLALLGGVGIAINALNKKDYPASTLNLIYAFIALIALFRIFF